MNKKTGVRVKTCLSLYKAFILFSIILFFVTASGFDCIASEESNVISGNTTDVRKIGRQSVKRAIRIKKRHPVVAKEAAIKMNESDAIEVPQYEVEISGPVPIKREYRAVRAIPVQLTKEDVRYYLEELKYGETFDDMVSAAAALGSRGMMRFSNDPIMKDVSNALITVFKEYDDELLLKEIASTLGKLGIEEAGSVLVNYLSSGDNNRVKSAVIRSLGRLEHRNATGILIRILQYDDDRELRIHSAAALGMIKDTSASYPLISALNDKDRDVRKEAIGALGNIGSQEAKPPLTSILNYDKDLELREEAARALRKIEDNIE